jgi:hypothetical protein
MPEAAADRRRIHCVAGSLALKPGRLRRRIPRTTMADHSTTQSHGHPAMDYAEHERTYRLFTAFVKWGTIVVAVIVVGMYVFLV